MGRRVAALVRATAAEHRWLDEDVPLPDDATLATVFSAPKRERASAAQGSSVEPHRERVARWHDGGVQGTTIYATLQRDHGFTDSYSAIRRFIATLEATAPRVTTVLDFALGDAAQVDFGAGPVLLDSRTNAPTKTWFFVMTLAWSRHRYCELVTDQSVETWLGCHRRAFEWFNGVPARIIIDNPKCAITKACYHDPLVQHAYADYALGYGFVIAPCPVRDSQKKGIVEAGVKYVKKSFAPLREFRDLVDANRQLGAWIMDVAGQRKHGTTHEQPLARFDAVGQALLRPLPVSVPECARWARPKLQCDCHVQVDKIRYSAPWRLVGQTLDVRLTESTVRIYHEHAMVAMHAIGRGAGDRRTVEEHLPPDAVAYKMRDPACCREQAGRIGPHCTAVVEQLFAQRIVEKLRGAQGIVRLAQRFGDARVELACRRALFFGNVGYGPIKTILDNELDRAIDPVGVFDTLPDAYTGASRFCRDTKDPFDTH